jgi:uncharacterized membrane protein YdfJ with MMPL/SSD domain
MVALGGAGPYRVRRQEEGLARFLYRLGRAAARRHWLVLALWAVLIAAAIVGARASGGETVDVCSIPGSQSEESIGELLGPANWWLPHWLDRILPRIEIE